MKSSPSSKKCKKDRKLVLTYSDLSTINTKLNGQGRCLIKVWGHSSAGRAPALQAGGRRFDPVWLHQL